MKTAILFSLILIATICVAQPLDDVHLSGIVHGFSNSDTTVLNSATVFIENLDTSHRDTVLTDSSGHWSWTGIVSAIQDPTPSLPTNLALAPGYPNPFSETTTIRILNNATQRVRLDVYNILGQRVAELFNGQLLPGAFEMTWNGVNSSGRPLTSGMYFLCLNAGGHASTQKLVILGTGSGRPDLTLRISNHTTPGWLESSAGPASKQHRRTLDDLSLRLEFRHADYDSLITSLTIPNGRDSALVVYLPHHGTPQEDMVLVPAGPYEMGATYQTAAQPVHTVTLPAFYIDIYEVTNAQYKVFCDSTGHAYPSHPGGAFYPTYFTNPTYANYPVCNVSQTDARDYATWAGKRLPTEAEWERAAKGNLDNRTYPWGNTWVAANANIYSNPADGYLYTSPVGNYPNGISPVGCYDMAGNVWEWCEDDGHDNYNGAPADGSAWINFPRSAFRVLRGGSWGLPNSSARCAYRYSDYQNPFSDYGFRCARTAPVNHPPAVPSSPIPPDSGLFRNDHITLNWTCSDPDNDPLVCDVHFGTTNTPPLVAAEIAATTFIVDSLTDSTTYYWQIIARDHHGSSTPGPVWSFRVVQNNTPGGMVLVPAGTFTMGSTIVGGFSIPEHTVHVPAFFMDVYEVTNAQYKAFCDATNREYPTNPDFYPNYFTDSTYANYPVLRVRWYDAREYAQWAGKRLPSEAEWERAAKGTTNNRFWPWGNTWVAANANVGNNNADGYEYTAPVGSFPGGISPAGCYDMAGNAMEWCEDDWHTGYYGAPTDGSAWINQPRDFDHVIRGGSWSHPDTTARCAARVSVWDFSLSESGFRCARTFVMNQSPTVPSNPSPIHQATDPTVDVILSWQCSDPDFDPLTFDIHFGTYPSPPLVYSGLASCTFDPGQIADSTTYYWQIVANDDHGNSSTGPIWSFSVHVSPLLYNMVRIPASTSTIGSGSIFGLWGPGRPVAFSEYYMDRFEVTNAQYRAFCDATGRAYPLQPTGGFFQQYFQNYPNYPVLMVTADDAAAYAAWVGKRLPTEAEWERAARGNQDQRYYPWGSTWDASFANGAGSLYDSFQYTAPVGSFLQGISPDGCFDMAGNVAEWCLDDWNNGYLGASGNQIPRIETPRDTLRVIRGGNWHESEDDFGVLNRSSAGAVRRFDGTGFRCVWSAMVGWPPHTPYKPSPADSTVHQAAISHVNWSCSDLDLDTLTYDVYLGTGNPPPLVSAGQSALSYNPGGLIAGTTYYWRVVAHDHHNNSAAGPLWMFTVADTGATAGMLLIPQHAFMMGSTNVGGASVPYHSVSVSAYYIDIYEVSNAQYKAFCDASDLSYPPDPDFATMPDYFTDPAFANYPVVNVSWTDARLYAAWAGKRLPSEAEWEMAAKGPLSDSDFPWGQIWDVDRANNAGSNYDLFPATAPVGTYRRGRSTTHGYDWAGNVYEYCEDDWHDSYTGAPNNSRAWVNSPRAANRVRRGGGWNDTVTGNLRCTIRFSVSPTAISTASGFRCAKTP
jgi:formylglycine-generating enzyme required for sulfatase activity